MAPQIKTLIPLFALFILLFLVVRHFLIPDSFGEQGHYRLNSVEENKDRPMHYAGKEACADCHDDMVTALATDLHAGISCESCHGPGSEHVNNPESVRMIKPDQRSFCGICHQYNPSRAKVITQVDLKEHNTGKKCIECHNPHVPWELKEENTAEESL